MIDIQLTWKHINTASIICYHAAMAHDWSRLEDTPCAFTSIPKWISLDQWDYIQTFYLYSILSNSKFIFHATNSKIQLSILFLPKKGGKRKKKLQFPFSNFQKSTRLAKTFYLQISKFHFLSNVIKSNYFFSKKKRINNFKFYEKQYLWFLDPFSQIQAFRPSASPFHGTSCTCSYRLESSSAVAARACAFQ